ARDQVALASARLTIWVAAEVRRIRALRAPPRRGFIHRRPVGLAAAGDPDPEVGADGRGSAAVDPAVPAFFWRRRHRDSGSPRVDARFAWIRGAVMSVSFTTEGHQCRMRLVLSEPPKSAAGLATLRRYGRSALRRRRASTAQRPARRARSRGAYSPRAVDDPRSRRAPRPTRARLPGRPRACPARCVGPAG